MAKRQTHLGWGAEDIPTKLATKRVTKILDDSKLSNDQKIDAVRKANQLLDEADMAKRAGRRRTFANLAGTSGLGPDVKQQIPVRFTTHAAGIDAPIRAEQGHPEVDKGMRGKGDLHGRYGFDAGTPIRDAMQEVYRQSPAMQVADQILGNFTRPDDDPSLADLFIANTYAEPNNYSGRVRKMMADTMLSYRLDMQKAHRFVLDDQFVEYATHVASVGYDKLMNRIGAATLPYEQTWIEFNLHRKVETVRKIHKVNDRDMSQISPRLGMLLQRINDTDMVCTMVPEPADRLPVPHLTSYFFSTREVDFFAPEMMRNYYGCRPFNFHWDDVASSAIVQNEGMTDEDFKEAALQIGKATLWGYSRDEGGMLPKVGHTRLMVPPVLMHHGDSGYSRMYNAVRELRGDTDERLINLSFGELRELSGQMRWIVTLLAMLNEVPVHANLIQRSHEMRIDRLRKRKFVDYHKVTLKIPKVRPIPFIERRLSHAEAQRRRAHEVRGHWRTYLKEGYCRRDQHEWVWDEENGYRLCGKCMSYSTFIREHVRGDPNLGWVRKDYVVEKARIP